MDTDISSCFNNYTVTSDGEDFTGITAVPVTIPASGTMACTDIPIIDDDLALEEDESFGVTLDTPPGIPSSSPDASTVTIIDNDST